MIQAETGNSMQDPRGLIARRVEGFKQKVREHLVDSVEYATDGSVIYTSHIRRGPLRGREYSIDHFRGISNYVVRRYEPEVTSQMRKYVSSGDMVFDIGAHAGFMSMYLSTLVGEQGNVFSFEPSSRNRALLRRNIDGNHMDNVTIIPAAVSNKSGFGTLLLSNTSSYEHALAHYENEYLAHENVPVISIDLFVAEKGSTPSFIKVDVEGEELAVFKGAQGTLNSHRPIVIAEVNVQHFEEVANVMGKNGYTAKILSRKNSAHMQRGTPNVLFTPRM